MKLDLKLNPVRYADHEPFQGLSPEQLDQILEGFDTTKLNGRLLVSTARILDFSYFGEICFFVQGELPEKISLDIIDKIPSEQQELVAKAHDLCSTNDFWHEVVNNNLPLFHFIEHAIMAVYIAVLSGILGRKFEAGFFTYPTPDEQEQGVLCHTYILQNYKIDPSVFLDIIQLAIEYANAIVTKKPMDILARIQNKIVKYPRRRLRRNETPQMSVA